MLANAQTHCDIIDDFSQSFVDELVKLSKELDFVIFEDRKFADIGAYLVPSGQSSLHQYRLTLFHFRQSIIRLSFMLLFPTDTLCSYDDT